MNEKINNQTNMNKLVDTDKTRIQSLMSTVHIPEFIPKKVQINTEEEGEKKKTPSKTLKSSKVKRKTNKHE